MTRNLAWGIALLALAAIGYWLGLYYAGGAATRTLVACLLTFGVVWLLLHFNSCASVMVLFWVWALSRRGREFFCGRRLPPIG